MKRIKWLVVMVLALASFTVFSQSKNVVITQVADTSKVFTTQVEAGGLIYNLATNTMYRSTKQIGVTAKKNLNYLIANGYYHFVTVATPSDITTTGNATVGGTFAVTSTSAFTGKGTFTAGTGIGSVQTLTRKTGNDNAIQANNSIWATDSLAAADIWGSVWVASPIVTATTTLTLPGTTTITKTSGNANSATTSGSLYVGNGNDTLTATVINGATKIYTPDLTATTTLTLPGTTTLTKTSGNGNSATLSHSLVVTDTATVGTINGSTKIYTPDLKATTTLTLPGTTTVTKTSGNANSATTSGSLYVGNGDDTLTATVINGATKIYSPSVAATTTLTLPGTTNTVAKTTGNANSVTFSHSAAVTDTLRLGTDQWLKRKAANANRIQAEGSIATGTSDTISAGLGEFTNAKVLTTLTLPGTTTITKTTGNGNSATLSHSLTVTDTITAGAPIIGTLIGVSGVDTVSAAPIGTICYKSSDSTLYIKINLTGNKGKRWHKVSVVNP
jgi:hypothetical protein